MSKIRLKLCLRIHKRIEKMKQFVKNEEIRLQRHLKRLTYDEMIEFGEETGYIETEQIDGVMDG